MIILTVANQKGGCAKTTTVVNLAAALAQLGKRVLVLDLDSQANASAWLNPSQRSSSAFDLMTTSQELEALITQTVTPDVDLIAGSRDLANLEKALAGSMSLETILKRRLSKLPSDGWDYLLIDTPPTIGLTTINALVASTHLLIPVTTHALTLSGVAQLVRAHEEVRELFNPHSQIMGFLPCRVDSRTRHSQEVHQALREKFGSKVFRAYIRENIRLAEAPSFGQSIFAYRPNSSAADDYLAVANEVLELTVQPNVQ